MLCWGQGKINAHARTRILLVFVYPKGRGRRGALGQKERERESGWEREGRGGRDMEAILVSVFSRNPEQKKKIIREGG